VGKRLVIYLVAEPETPVLAAAAVEAGADVIELGFPFSDPLADGPVIQRASERALGRGMRTARCLACLAETRALLGETPIVPMTYAALLEAYGWERFARDARANGATSLIVSDVPAGQRPELRRVHLVAPTSTDERIRLAARTTDGWLAGLVERTRPLADGVALYAGFGISTPQQAAAAASLADGVVVGSRAVQVAEDGPEALSVYVASLRTALDGIGD
jgi:tryptophan synthase alpha chain